MIPWTVDNQKSKLTNGNSFEVGRKTTPDKISGLLVTLVRRVLVSSTAGSKHSSLRHASYI